MERCKTCFFNGESVFVQSFICISVYFFYFEEYNDQMPFSCDCACELRLDPCFLSF